MSRPKKLAFVGELGSRHGKRADFRNGGRCVTALWFAGWMALFAAVLRVEFHIPVVHSLKEKRGVIKPVIDGLKNRFNVSVAETDFQDLWQRCEIGIGVVASSASHAQDVIDACDRFVWSFPEITITTSNVDWLEPQ
jgi:uncharacterized protein